MKISKININSIPSIIWGEKSDKVYIAVHGNMSNKEDDVIKILADNVTSNGYQVLSFDLPEHGERRDNKEYLCKVQNCVEDLKQMIQYAKENYKEISLWACSMGAYFSLLAYKDEIIKQCLFLSPIVNMKKLIDNMMLWSNTTEEKLERKQEIKTDFGQTLYWDYYKFVKDNPIMNWYKKTYILYGKNDELQDNNTMEEFCKKFNAELTVMENGEHFFHTEEQLDYYKNWINKVTNRRRII